MHSHASSTADAVVEDSSAMDPVLRQMLETQKRRMALRSEMAALRREAQQQTATPWWEVDCPPNMINVGSVEELAASLEEARAQGLLAVVNFFSPECYACRSMQPKLRQIARDADGSAVFLKVNGFVDGLREHCEREGITRIPYFHFYRGGERVAEFTANMQPEKLKLLRRTIELNTACSGGPEAPAV